MPSRPVAFLSSQNPGVIAIILLANALFGSDPPINDVVLAKGLILGLIARSVIHALKAPLASIIELIGLVSKQDWLFKI